MSKVSLTTGRFSSFVATLTRYPFFPHDHSFLISTRFQSHLLPECMVYTVIIILGIIMVVTDIACDLPKGTALLNELSSSAINVCNIVKRLSTRVKEESLQTEKGISLLELKNHLYLSYLANLSFTTLLKLSGLSLQGHSSIDNLVELRVILERIRPIEHKIKHQIENHIKNSTSQEVNGGAGQVHAKNSLDNIDDSSDEEESTPSSSKETQLYKIPKISQTHFPGEEEKGEARQRRERSRILSSAMLRDALQEHTDDPEVIHNMDTLKQKSIEKRKQIERYEEDNFTRLTLSKKERASLRQISTPGTIGADILSFRSLDGLEDGTSTSDRGKKRKRANSKVKKGKSFKKKRR